MKDLINILFGYGIGANSILGGKRPIYGIDINPAL